MLLTFQGRMACPQLNSWRPGGEQDTEERSLASHREGDREWRKKREVGGKDRERGALVLFQPHTEESG